MALPDDGGADLLSLLPCGHNPGFDQYKQRQDDPMFKPEGRHFLQIPGPTNVPDRVLRALAAPTIDHRGPEFAKLTKEVLEGLKVIFKTKGRVIVYPSSGTGAWEAALINTLSPGDKVLMFETGHFAALWCNMAQRLGLDVDFVPGDWRSGVDPAV
ncbi:MAG: aminotransferase class V-fold PLP-dependent enzyme, partial [Acidiferrobacterales bacterium]|nr:aminotransferase class V-fold PLP-dependent enzyme [Acidiferrobacterales bacterium]